MTFLQRVFKITTSSERKQFYIINVICLMIMGILSFNLSVVIVPLMCLVVIDNILIKEDLDKYKICTIILIISYVFILIMYYWYFSFYGAPYYFGNSDDYQFESLAKKTIEMGLSTPWEMQRNELFINNNSIGFIWSLSILMRICNLFGGYHTLTFRIINIYFLMCLGLLAQKYFNKYYLKSDKYKYLLLISVSLFPNSIYISAHVFRDTISAFIVFLVFYITDKIDVRQLWEKKYIYLKYILEIIVLIIYGYYIRSMNAVYAIAIIFVTLLFKHKLLTKKNIKHLVVMVICSCFFITIFDLWGLLEYYIITYTNYNIELSSGSMTATIFSVPLLPFGIFLRILYGFIYPNPIFLKNILNMFSNPYTFFYILNSLGTIIQIFLIPYFVLGMKKIGKEIISFFIIYFSIIMTTFGFRHFIYLYPFYFILCYRTLQECADMRKKKIFVGTMIFIAISCLIYCGTKLLIK